MHHVSHTKVIDQLIQDIVINNEDTFYSTIWYNNMYLSNRKGDNVVILTTDEIMKIQFFSTNAHKYSQFLHKNLTL